MPYSASSFPRLRAFARYKRAIRFSFWPLPAVAGALIIPACVVFHFVGARAGALAAIPAIVAVSAGFAMVGVGGLFTAFLAITSPNRRAAAKVYPVVMGTLFGALFLWCAIAALWVYFTQAIQGAG